MSHICYPSMTACRICPRACGVDRAAGSAGVCGMPAEYRVARIAPHMWEEPPISGNRGSGTVFFSGCNLRCVFCQNRTISREGVGEAMTEDVLRDRILALLDQGVHNLNLVTPDAYAPRIVEALGEIKGELGLPIVINCGGYLSPVQIDLFSQIADVWLPDFKYADPALAGRLSGTPDYPEVALNAIGEMVKRVGKPAFDENGILQKGVVCVI